MYEIIIYLVFITENVISETQFHIIYLVIFFRIFLTNEMESLHIWTEISMEIFKEYIYMSIYNSVRKVFKLFLRKPGGFQ